MVSRLHTFLFADLAGFTEFTARHGDDRAAELAVSFHEHVSTLAGAHGCEVVKTIGDAVMVRGEDCRVALLLAREILEHGGRDGLPRVRVGLDTGPAVERNGDWFGSTVNIASRVTAAAPPGELRLTERARDCCERELACRGRHRLKGLTDGLALFAA